MQISSQTNPLNIYQQRTDTISQNRNISAGQAVSVPLTTQPAPTQSDSVHFSSDAKLLAEATKVASADDGSRVEMIARLREQVQNGTYSMDDKKIAEGIVKEDSVLFTV